MRRKNIDEISLYSIWLSHAGKLKLKTKNSDEIEILDTGEVNTTDGADFTDAKVKINGKIYRGDVEIHIKASDWKNHKHHLDERYNTVILHVVLHDDTGDGFVQTVSGRKVLTAEIESDEILHGRITKNDKIKCYGVNKIVSVEEKLKWIKNLGLTRLFFKARNLSERLSEIIDENFFLISDSPKDYFPTYQSYSLYQLSHRFVWDQLLYEKVMEALGYSKNKLPFQKLAQNLTLKFISEHSFAHSYEKQILRIQALLFGVAGFIDHYSGKKLDAETKLFIDELKKEWMNVRGYYHREVLHHSEWHFSSVRPANSPAFKLGGASVLIWRMIHEDFYAQLNEIIISNLDVFEKVKRLENLFRVKSEGYWETHYNFGKSRGVKTDYMVGISKAREIVVNAVLPVMMTFSRIFKNRELEKKVIEIYKNFPNLSANWITAKLEDELFFGRVKLSSSGLTHQGGIHLFKFYCSNSLCNACAIGNKLFL
ncbi:DUF2851 family protein [Candidatus Chrysopegis kryptomonas]|uniref:DUF2851 domain-containing protein n=1 Tax=Candidatus Chryseopegocella kryptomonas TaxID=1633643 RepID=A0A0N7MWV3_9BACT|nr:DUF2851 family protein [Candidatus Chrysopegis kryptomonas]CUS99683.1 Protein of unknown function (DUF2851) [Candidatus Chrysopegis kryptomonas]